MTTPAELREHAHNVPAISFMALQSILLDAAAQITALQAQAVADAQSAESLRERVVVCEKERDHNFEVLIGSRGVVADLQAKCAALEKELAGWKDEFDHVLDQRNALAEDARVLSSRHSEAVVLGMNTIMERDAERQARAGLGKELDSIKLQAHDRVLKAEERARRYGLLMDKANDERDAERQARAGLREQYARLTRAVIRANVFYGDDDRPSAKSLWLDIEKALADDAKGAT